MFLVKILDRENEIIKTLDLNRVSARKDFRKFYLPFIWDTYKDGNPINWTMEFRLPSYNQRQHILDEFMNIIGFRKKVSKTFAFYFHELYMWASSKDNEEHSKNRVYDHLGMIDTLGWDKAEGNWTFNYSDEGVYAYGFKLPFGYNVSIADYCGNDKRYLSLYWEQSN